MGLDVSHDCWNGAYSAFMRWRCALGVAAGYPEFSQGYAIYELDQNGHPVWASMEKERPALSVLMNHSDCDGVLEVPILLPLAEELEAIAATMPDVPDVGHLVDGMKAVTLRFARGLRRAAEAGEVVEFS